MSIVATTVTFADKSDPATATVTLSLAEANLVLAGSKTEIAEAVLDKGYHDNELLVDLAKREIKLRHPESGNGIPAQVALPESRRPKRPRIEAPASGRTGVRNPYGHVADQVFLREALQGLAQRRAPDAQALHQRRLLDRRAGGKLGLDDQAAKLVIDGIALPLEHRPQPASRRPPHGHIQFGYYEYI